jgi:hypothetical protein
MATRTAHVPIHKRSNVVLQKIICKADYVLGTIDFEESGQAMEASLRDLSICSGTMKLVFDASIFSSMSRRWLITTLYSCSCTMAHNTLRSAFSDLKQMMMKTMKMQCPHKIMRPQSKRNCQGLYLDSSTSLDSSSWH